MRSKVKELRNERWAVSLTTREAERIDAYRAQLASNHGVAVTRSDAVRALALKALAVQEASEAVSELAQAKNNLAEIRRMRDGGGSEARMAALKARHGGTGGDL